MQDERLDIVDENDRVVGQQWRSEVYRQGLPNFRVINAFVYFSPYQIKRLAVLTMIGFLRPLTIATQVGEVDLAYH